MIYNIIDLWFDSSHEMSSNTISEMISKNEMM